jgi:tetratricopeptide (TPR) repeat protein
MTDLVDTADLAPEPERIGPYRVARRLGHGGMGEVFLAWDERLGRRVALKRIRHGASTSRARERFRREAWAAARLSHPAVVQIYDLIEDATGDSIVLEYVEGRTLRALLAEGLPSFALALRLARDIAEGLAAAHAAGLVHRDLKAENVMVTPAGQAKILDFGLAKPMAEGGPGEGLTAQGALLGTFHAMSPEQARGSEVDARSDLFSFGVLLYEMLTGHSPFRGNDLLDTLQKVNAWHPPPVATLRPEIPGALSRLVDRLLAKHREERPASAAEVVLGLAALAAEPGVAEARGLPPERREERWDDRPTLVASAAALSAHGEGRVTGTGVLLTRARRLPALGLAVALAVLALTIAYLVRRSAPETLRVVVLAPQVPPGTEDLRLASSVLLTSALSTLAALDGVAPLDPAQAGPGLAASAPVPTAAARIAAADEVVTLFLETWGRQGARVALRRIQGRDGRVLWTGSFPVPAGSSDRDLRLLADALGVQLRRAYSDHPPRPDTPAPDVRDRDYAELLRIRERMDRGSADLEPELEKLEEIVRASPGFLEAHLQAAAVAKSLFDSTREAAYLERARLAARAAEELAPGDPRPLEARFRIALAGQRPDEAQEALAALEETVPGDPQLHVLSGLLAESRGDLEQAIADLTLACRSAPSWRNLFLLADLELRAGRTAEGRRHLEELLAVHPGNPWGMERLGNLELLEGDPGRAAEIFLEMIGLQPLRPYYTNLGLARSLLGRPGEAAEAYRQALALDPGHARVLLNLADAELAQGHESAASDLYRRALRRFDEVETAGALSARDRMDKAQCLVHLGRVRDAVELAQQALRESGDDPETFFAASLVYALAGDRASALVNAELALDKGVQPRWFTLPVFGALRNDPELSALLLRR